MSASAAPRPRGVLARLGLHRPELRAWAMYDWANSAFVTTIMTAVFPIYFKKVAAAGLPDAVATGYVATANSVALGANSVADRENTVSVGDAGA